MQPDVEKYLPYLDGHDLTEARKVELIHSIWRITESFADRAFGLHPVQLAKAQEEAADSNAQEHRVGSREDATTIQFRQAAGSSGRREGTNHEGE